MRVPSLLGAVAIAALIVGMPFCAARSADMAVKAPSAAANWTGWYIGGNFGYALGSSDSTTSTTFIPGLYLPPTSVAAINAAGAQQLTPNAFTGGVQTGANTQVANYVVGIEFDFELLGANQAASTSQIYPCAGTTCPAGSTFSVGSQVKADWLTTVRPRVGYAFDNVLVYATAGLAVTDIRANFGFTDSLGVAEAASISRVKAGWAAGAGFDCRIAGGWSARFEYLYADFGGVATSASLSVPPAVGGITPSNPFSHSADLNFSIVRAGLNYKLF